MITNNNFNPLRVFCQQTFDLTASSPFMKWQWRNRFLTKKGILLKYEERKTTKRGKQGREENLFWVDYIYSKAVGGLGTYNILAALRKWLQINNYVHGLVIEKYNFCFGMISWSAENTIFCYLKITEPCRRKMKENHPNLVKSHELICHFIILYLVPLPP